jgi:hypothetical protein
VGDLLSTIKLTFMDAIFLEIDELGRILSLSLQCSLELVGDLLSITKLAFMDEICMQITELASILSL